jgi:DNA-binding CsgD family transcriptional regulator/tetratricopeptide (TPR) repeat protein
VDAPRAPIVGRSRELARFEAAIDAARAGSLRILLIGGESGVGKTRLVQECLARLDNERVLFGACLPLEGASIPYAPIRQALRGLVESLEPRPASVVLGAARAELGRLLPEIASSSETSALPAAEPAAQARLFELVLGVIDRLARLAPVVLVIEDLHWADPATRDLIAVLGRNMRRSPVLLVLTIRSDDLTDDHPVIGLLAELERLEYAERLELDRFSRQEVASLLLLLTGVRPTAETLDRILGRSDGNPFFVEQLVAAGEAAPGLPARLADTLRARVGRLSDPTRGVLRAAAAAARPVDDEFLAELSGVDARDVGAAVREAISARILAPLDPDKRELGYTFRHALLREVIYDELHPAERRRLHRGVASALKARAGRRSQGIPLATASELAFHWDTADAWSEAIPAHLEAAAGAADVYAWTAVVHHYSRVLALLDSSSAEALPSTIDRAEVLHRAADAAFLAADYPRAIEWGRAAIEAVAATEPRRAGAYHVRLRWYLWDSGDRQGAVAAVEEALRLLPVHPPSAERASALAQWSGALMHTGRVQEAASVATEALALARLVGARSDEAEALAILGWIDVVIGRQERGFPAMAQAVTIAEEVGDVSGIALGHALIAHMYAYVDQPRDALAAGLRGYEAITRLGAERTYGPVLLGHAAKALLELGEWSEADRLIALGFDHELVDRPAHALRIQRGRLAMLRGSFEAAEADLAAARSFEAASAGSEYGDDLLAAEAELAAWSGTLAGARAAWESLADRLRAAPPTPQLAWVAAVAMRAEADEAEQARARRDTDRERTAREGGAAILEAWPGPPAGPVRLLAEAERTRLEGRPDPAAWSTVVEAWDRLDRPFHAAEARYRQAEALLGPGADRGEAALLLAAAHATCTRLRADALGHAVARLARRARVPLGTAAPTVTGGDGQARAGPEPLTPREADVLRLVAGGWTNRQIADELFISPRTAAVHVTNIFGKLGANSRVEAAAIAHRLGLAADPPRPPDTAKR